MGLLILAPSMAMIALAIRLTMGRPILFRQPRPGLHERPFELVKFRTMTSATGPDGSELPDHERVTRTGMVLRRFSLDELPELWNVLKGDMSLVGPRPLLEEYLPRFSPEQARRHEVRPGITGLAQVRGRHELPWDDRLRLDVWYVDHWSIGGDLRIILQTFRVLFGGDARAEAPEFWGSVTSSREHDPGT
jgi:sugar transferase EpsL